MEELLKISHKEVGFIKAESEISRAGEGAFIKLNKNTIMFAFTAYDSEDFGDDASANILAVYSYDNGETWGKYKTLLNKNAGDCNIMSVSFLRLNSDEILMFYLKKTMKNGAILCQPFVRRSNDNCNSFGDELCCGTRGLYYVVNNDRVVQLKNGRIIIPAAIYRPKIDSGPMCESTVCMIVSDDNGYSWYEQPNELCMPMPSRLGLEEPGLYEHFDGSIWCYMRTQLGCQWESFSYDGGNTWSIPKPNVFFTSPDSPMLVKHVGKYTAAVFNPIPNYLTRQKSLWGRTPLILAVSETDGIDHNLQAFQHIYTIESDPENNYCYPAILDLGEEFLLAYYHSNGTSCPLNSLKIVKVKIV